MTKHLSQTIGLPSLEDAMREAGLDVPAASDGALPPALPSDAPRSLDEHGVVLEKLYDEVIGHARDLMDLGANMEHARARGIFEVASTMYKTALDVRATKREQELKALRLTLDQRKVEIEERRDRREAGGAGDPIIGEAVVTTIDRNELLRLLRDKR